MSHCATQFLKVKLRIYLIDIDFAVVAQSVAALSTHISPMEIISLIDAVWFMRTAAYRNNSKLDMKHA